MIKVVIIEDEQPAIERLNQLIASSGEKVTIVKTLGSIEESVNWFSNNPSPDLVFVDVQLSDGVCFEIFESIKISIPVIFTTAFDSYAIKAFSVNSIDYLLKPIDPILLKQALDKYKDNYISEKENVIRKVISDIPLQFKSRFLIKTGIHFKSISVNDIESFYILGKSTFLMTKKGKSLDIDYSLDQLEKMVNPEEFFRANRNFLININLIKDMIGYSGSRIKLRMEYGSYEESIIISRERVIAFKNRMNR